MPRVPTYGVEATLEGDRLIVVLTLCSDAAYCCTEWGCHLALRDGKRWHTLRACLAEQAVTLPARLRLQLTCVIEHGARFFDPAPPGSWTPRLVRFHGVGGASLRGVGR